MLNPANGHYYAFYSTTQGTMSNVLLASTKTIVVSDRYYLGHMLTITSKAEQEFVHNTLGARADVWLGLSDSSSEGYWRWIDGPEAGLSPAWSAWADGEPNGGIGQNCVCSTSDLLWFDVSCGSFRSFVIEYELQQSSVPGTAFNLYLFSSFWHFFFLF